MQVHTVLHTAFFAALTNSFFIEVNNGPFAIYGRDMSDKMGPCIFYKSEKGALQ